MGHLLEAAVKKTLKLLDAAPQHIYIKHVPLAPTNPQTSLRFQCFQYHLIAPLLGFFNNQIYQPEVQKSPSDLVGCGTRPFPAIPISCSSIRPMKPGSCFISATKLRLKAIHKMSPHQLYTPTGLYNPSETHLDIRF